MATMQQYGSASFEPTFREKEKKLSQEIYYCFVVVVSSFQ